MLKNHLLNSLPLPKFVLIEDTLKCRSEPILDSILKTHQRNPKISLKLCITGGVHKKCVQKYGETNIEYIDASGKIFSQNSNNNNTILVIDSLVHLFYSVGPNEAFKTLNKLKQDKNILQIIAVLHADLLDDESKNLLPHLRHVSTLHMEVVSATRVAYCFKKTARKVFKQIEEYSVCDGIFATNPVRRPEKEHFIQAAISDALKPEEMSTFKIGLTDTDRVSRENLVLPYLPKAATEGAIHYTLDHADDWDEEDPDDDLDI